MHEFDTLGKFNLSKVFNGGESAQLPASEIMDVVAAFLKLQYAPCIFNRQTWSAKRLAPASTLMDDS